MRCGCASRLTVTSDASAALFASENPYTVRTRGLSVTKLLSALNANFKSTAYSATSSGACVSAPVTSRYVRKSSYDYRVIVDRLSHEVPFYRFFLKAAALAGTYVIN